MFGRIPIIAPEAHNVNNRRFRLRSTPKGLPKIAQGCAYSRYPGERSRTITNPLHLPNHFGIFGAIFFLHLPRRFGIVGTVSTDESVYTQFSGTNQGGSAADQSDTPVSALRPPLGQLLLLVGESVCPGWGGVYSSDWGASSFNACERRIPL